MLLRNSCTAISFRLCMITQVTGNTVSVGTLWLHIKKNKTSVHLRLFLKFFITAQVQTTTMSLRWANI